MHETPYICIFIISFDVEISEKVILMAFARVLETKFCDAFFNLAQRCFWHIRKYFALYLIVEDNKTQTLEPPD